MTTIYDNRTGLLEVYPDETDNVVYFLKEDILDLYTFSLSEIDTFLVETKAFFFKKNKDIISIYVGGVKSPSCTLTYLDVHDLLEYVQSNKPIATRGDFYD